MAELPNQTNEKKTIRGMVNNANPTPIRWGKNDPGGIPRQSDKRADLLPPATQVRGHGRRQCLPYYCESKRTRRSVAFDRYFANHVSRFDSAADRGLHFHAFKRFQWIFEKFLQNLFISRKTYPFSDGKWIEYQIVHLFGIESLPKELSKVFEIRAV